jgi:hypothetical protein
LLNKIKARLNRNKASEYPAHGSPESGKGGELAQLRERLAEKNQRLKRTRRQLAKKDRVIADLRAELIATKGNGSTSPSSGEAMPVFFVLGLAKSGTSWLMRTLDSHPEILCKGEGKFFGKDSPRSLHGALANSEELQKWFGLNPWTRNTKDPHLQDLMRLIVNYLMEEKLRKSTKKLVGDKTPFLSEEMVDEVAAICPNAKVIHIVRDGRDVAVSSVFHRWNNATDQGGPFKLTSEQMAKREAYRSDPRTFVDSGNSIFSEGNVAASAKEWHNKVSRISQDGHALLGDRYYEVHYENLLMNPTTEVQRLLGFLDAASSKEVSQQCVEAASFDKLSKGRKPGEEDSSSFYRKGVAGDWKNYFTGRDKKIFKEEAGDLLIRLGYEEDYDW